MQVTMNYLCDLTGFDRRTVQKRLRGLPKITDIHYESTSALRLLFIPEGLDPAQEKARLDRSRREILELEKAQREGNLIPAEAVKQRWEEIAGNVRAHLLNLPGRLAIAVNGASTQQEAEMSARTIIYEVLTELSKGGPPK